ncbi:gas vesicle protein GvpN [Spartinivicinus ruber]|uniref:gas vesicle protein GvpN n=1 Tax=Spartinivicinus ruber TaxID=2683272 RepID=UPI0013D3611E|nr:gas vesicle protein GvpN [Spartinivicinus ruber]
MASLEALECQDKIPAAGQDKQSSAHVNPEASESFVCTPYIHELTTRALAYLSAGYPIHLAGPAGTGKTTLAFHIASKLDRPVNLMHGNEEAKASDWAGNANGYRRRTVVDNYIRSVVRSEEELSKVWVDNRLTTSCINGEVLIYDEFNRSRPEVNNIFISVLSERILDLPQRHLSGGGYVQVHPEFRAIFTSNPEEYAGTYKAQDALMDRLITIKMGHFDCVTELNILQAKSGISLARAERIVEIMTRLREYSIDKYRPTIRSGIAIAKVMAQSNTKLNIKNNFFRQVCYDLLSVDVAKVHHNGTTQIDKERELIDEVLNAVCKSGG